MAVRVLRVVGRYLAGTLLVAILVVAGVALRIVRVGHQDERAPADAIVVLGAAQYNGRPSDVYAARLNHGAELYRTGVAKHIVTTGGGQPGDRLTEGEAGRQFLLQAGIPASALVSVGVGDDTLVSLRAVDHELTDRDWKSVVLVT